MKIAYFDCIAGASGDMLLGAMLDAGLPETDLIQNLSALNLADFELRSNKVTKNGFSATKVDIIVKDDVPERHLAEIQQVIAGSSLPENIKDRAQAIFQRLAQVEAEIHGQPVEQVHLHELGGVDTIVDVIGVLLGVQLLGIERVACSPLPLGRGFVRGAHGSIPLPAPATLALLKGVPVVGSDIEKELVTPTGAALLTALSESFSAIPAMRLLAVGYGAGGRDLPIPNVLRLLIGEAPEPTSAQVETLVMLETNIDNLNPEIYEHVMAQLFIAGALDVTLAPIQMKKNRPATQLAALCRPAQADALEAILFAETSTLGVRRQLVERHALGRAMKTVQTPFGPVRVKLALLGDGHSRPAPEYEDCRQLAQASGRPLWEIYQAAVEGAEGMP